MTFELFGKMLGLFVGLFLAGTLLCLPLYNWDVKRFFSSQLWTKALWWGPIFLGLLAILYGGLWAAVLVAVGLIFQAMREFFHHQAYKKAAATAYVVFFCITSFHLVAFFSGGLALETTTYGLIVVGFSSALSDIFAFFCGKYAGKHPLPAWINSNKYWEGVGGQIIGALIGYGLVSVMVGINDFWLLAFAVGVASAIGDLVNSIIKRTLGIKDWGNTIPGHGGVLDRFSSLLCAVAFSYWVLKIL